MWDATTVAAWWGAIIATSILLWDVYKWKRRGPNVVLRVQGDMNCMEGNQALPGTWLTFRGANVGDRPTTLENVTIQSYPNLWARIRSKPDKSYWIPKPGFYENFPYKLEPGETWNGRVEQDAELNAKANEGYLVCCLHHSSSKRPATCRVRLKP